MYLDVCIAAIFTQEIRSKIQLENTGELHDLYMITDTMLLRDVFESFRMTSPEK